ncbi:hypothetical protein [Streptomyces carpaticus]|uniref:ATP-binding protein n=1 Tax=Streptomyces carpaticus TaxID=285558 RepID=A0ABV4ZSZ2_9ACTN
MPVRLSVPDAAVPSVVASLVAGAALPPRYRHPLPIAGVAVAVAGLFGAMLPMLLVAFRPTAHRRARVAAAGIAAMVLGLWAAASRRLADALADLRHVLGAAARTGHGGGPGAHPAGAGRTDRHRARAGQLIDTDLDEPGGAGAPAAHRLAVYRLVQEALGNARRHAPHTTVRVAVRYGPLPRDGEAGGDPPGSGLVGLRERVQCSRWAAP